MSSSREIILASGSTYRRALLARILPDFRSITSNVDESPLAGELPRELSARLAAAKAEHISESHPMAIIIGSDQVASLGGQALGKPGDHLTAAKQLQACSGRSVDFYTAVDVRCKASGFVASHIDVTTVNFRELSPEEIDSYLSREKPWDCAGSFKSEGLGAALFESIDNHDPTALIGLPLIWLANCLRQAGLPILISG